MNLIVLEIIRSFSFSKKNVTKKKSVKVLMRKKWNNKVRFHFVTTTNRELWVRMIILVLRFLFREWFFVLLSFVSLRDVSTFASPPQSSSDPRSSSNAPRPAMQRRTQYVLRQQSSQDWQCSTMRSSAAFLNPNCSATRIFEEKIPRPTLGIFFLLIRMK